MTAVTKWSIGIVAMALVAASIAACATSTEDVGGAMNASTPPGAEAGASPAPSTDPSQEVDASIDPGASGTDAGMGFTYGPWSELSVCSVTCGTGTRTRTRECRRRDGVPVNCRLCGNECVDDSTQCTTSICCDSREICCPVQSYAVAAPDVPTCTSSLAERVAQCEAKGCLWDGARTCKPGGIPSNPTFPGGTGTCK